MESYLISTSMEPEAPPTSELYIAGALNIKKPDHKQALISTPRSGIILRRVVDEKDALTLVSQRNYAFRPSPAPVDNSLWEKEKKEIIDYVYYILAIDAASNNTLASSGLINATVNIRGRITRIGGVTCVTSFPEGRRKGNVKLMFENLFTQHLEQNLVFSALYPFKESFYERLGYVSAPRERLLVFPTEKLNSLLNREVAARFETGNSELLRLDSADPNTVELLYDLLKEVQSSQHGMMVFSNGRRERIGWHPDVRAWVAVVKIDGRVVGAAVYRITAFKGRIHVRHFYYLNATAKYLLLQFLAKHQDQTLEVAMMVRADEYPETWVADLAGSCSIEKPDYPAGGSFMYRVALVLGLNGLPSPVHHSHGFVANVIDPQCAWNTHQFAFAVDENELKVRETDQKGRAFDLSIQGLSALVCYGASPADLVCRGWSKAPEDIWPVMEKMFPPQTPHLHEWF